MYQFSSVFFHLKLTKVVNAQSHWHYWHHCHHCHRCHRCHRCHHWLRSSCPVQPRIGPLEEDHHLVRSWVPEWRDFFWKKKKEKRGKKLVQRVKFFFSSFF